MLADNGAHVSVIKSEDENGMKYNYLNRNKETIIVNLKKKEERERLKT